MNEKLDARHYIKDESIGGIEREYVEVEREVAVGDYVHITYFKGREVSAISKVTETSCTSGDFYFEPKLKASRFFDDGNAIYKTLEPTDIVRIDGERYRLVDRKAEVGEKVLIVEAKFAEGKYANGCVINAERISSYGIKSSDGFIMDEEYCVLVPVESDLLVTVDATQASESVLDMLANLARRVTQLESRLQTFAEQTESNTQDIALLDERTNNDSSSKTIELLCAHIVKQGGARP